MVEGTYRGGTHNLDVSNVIEVHIEAEGGGGGGGTSGNGGPSGTPGSGGNGGYVSGDFFVGDDDQLTLQINSGRTSGHYNGGVGGTGGSGNGTNAGEGGHGAGSTHISGDVTGSMIVAEGGGAGGGNEGIASGGAFTSPGGGGGGGARGGSGGSGLSDTDGDAEPGGNGGGSGDGGYGGNASNTGSGNPGGPGGQSIVVSASNTSTNTGGGVTGVAGSNNNRTPNDGRVTVTILQEATRPQPPVNVAVSVSGTETDHSWDEPNNQDNYDEWRIYRSQAPGTTKNDTRIATLSPGTTTYTDTGLDEGERYYYVITAYVADDGSGNSFESDESSEVDATTVLPVPTNLAADAVTNADADFSWTLNSTDEDGVLVEYRLIGDSSWTVAADLAVGTESYNLTGLFNGRDYEARVGVYTEHVTEYDA